MNKFWIVLFHTYWMKLKTKSFIITTAIMLLLVVALTNLPKIIDFFSGNEQDKIGVIDETGAVYDQLAKTLTDMEVTAFENEAAAKKQFDEEKIKGYLIIESDEVNVLKATYKSSTLTNTSISSTLSAVLTQIKTKMVANNLQLTDEQIATLNAPIPFENVAFESNAKSEEELSEARGLVYIILFVIYFSVLMYANMIAMEVATEKTSRVMEVLISSVSPIQQMFAKIFGIALLSITQLLLFFITGYVSIKRNLSELEHGFFAHMGLDISNVSIIIYAIVFTLLGYLLYATLAACLGSIVSRIEDVQQMITPMTFLVIAAFLIAMFGLGDPSTSFITITSFIPFFSPMIMFLRVGMLDVPVWEVSLSILLLIGTIVLLAIFGAKVYKGGVLMYGGSKSLKNIKNALQLSKKE